MSVGSPKLERREKVLEATRRRLRRLEIETHRIKAELARLEAEYEDDVADWMTRKLRRRPPSGAEERFDPAHDDGPRIAGQGAPAAVLPFTPPRPMLVRRKAVSGTQLASDSAHTAKIAEPPPAIVAEPSGSNSELPPERRAGNLAKYRKTAPPILFSLVIHAAALVLCVTLTFATIVEPRVPLYASPTADENDIPAELGEIKIEPTKFDDPELTNTIAEREEFNLADNLLRDAEPAELGAGAKPQGDIGQLDALPRDLATLMAGLGTPSKGKPGGEMGAAVFFGARSKGDRFVFVIDNSSSMKGGRLDMAAAELLKTVDALSPRQSFYVIFVSDQPYPMFYPEREADLIPATPANKKRLAEWMPKAILASGKNRELMTAMDMAAALRPQAVYLLWDGDLRYSEKVRFDVMTHLTQPQNFTVHTLGMGITSLDSEQNLATIARAHGGIYRRIDLPPARGR
jgi:hypothetical protein